MTGHSPAPGRRRLLALAGAGAAVCAFPAATLAQGGRTPAPTGRPLTVVQLYDTSAEQQDVAKDFLIGSRAAWQDISARGGIKGRPVQHLSIEVDGSPASVRAALAQALGNPDCVALTGTCGDPVASETLVQLRQANAGIAHVAPWLQNSSVEVDERTFPIFAARQEQVAHAIRSLSTIGVTDLGAVYASPAQMRLYQPDVQRLGAELKVRIQAFQGDGDLSRLGQRLGATTPPVLLFLGGTPELVQFTQGLDRQARQRYVVALADVNLQTLQQMGGGKSTPVIATQAVPMVNASLQVVRSYREVLGRLFDEPPTPLSLAGFIAARYTFEVLRDIDGPLTRASALAAFQRRETHDVGGYRVAFDARRRSAAYVTQSMLTIDGRVIG